MKRWIIGCILLTVTRAAEWPLKVSVTEPTLVEVEIGPAMWEAVKGEARRLTVRDGEGRQVSVLRDVRRETKMETVWSSQPAEIQDLQADDGNRLELVCTVSENGREVHGMEGNR